MMRIPVSIAYQPCWRPAKTRTPDIERDRCGVATYKEFKTGLVRQIPRGHRHEGAVALLRYTSDYRFGVGY